MIGYFVNKESVPSLDDSPRVKLEEVRGGKYAKYLHKGDYKGMPDAWRRLKVWDGGKVTRREDGTQWEHYLVDQSHTTDSTQYETEIWWRLEDETEQFRLDIGHLMLLCHNQDDAIKFYTTKLGFKVQTDQKMPEGNRWISVVASPHLKFSLVLANTEEKKSVVGKQAGDHILAVLETDNFDKAYQQLKKNGVEFTSEPKHEFYGTEVIFKDLYGNLFDLIQVKPH